MRILIRRNLVKSTMISRTSTNRANIPRLHVTFIDKDGDKHEFEVAKGDNLLDIAQANDLEMEGELCPDHYL